MSNCLVIQNDKNVVINVLLAGIIKANQTNNIYAHVYGCLKGIDGLLNENLLDLSNMSEEEMRILKQTAGAALGISKKSSSYNEEDYLKMLKVLEEYDIKKVFLIGGKKTFNALKALNEYLIKEDYKEISFVLLPTDYQNELNIGDYSLGFSSAAKQVASVASNTYNEFISDDNEEVFILEVSGNKSGYLAASALLNKGVDLLLVPEFSFDKDIFLNEVKRCIKEKQKCYIVVASGIKTNDDKLVATYIDEEALDCRIEASASLILKSMIIETAIANKCQIANLAGIETSFINMQAKKDVEEALTLSEFALVNTVESEFVKVMAIKEDSETKYQVLAIEDINETVRNLNIDWIKPNYRGLKTESNEYLASFIKGNVGLAFKSGLVASVKPYFDR